MKKKTPNFTSVARNSPLPNRPEADGALILLEICQLIKLQKISLHQQIHIICSQTANKTSSLNALIPAFMELGSMNGSTYLVSDK